MNDMKIKVAFWLIALLSCISSSSHAQNAKTYIYGQVTYSTDSKPAAGIEVWARRLNAAELKGDAANRDRKFHKGITEKNGHYKIVGLQPGRYIVWLFLGDLGSGSRWVNNWAVRNHEVSVISRKGKRVNFQFVKGAMIEGRVVSKDTGKPVAGQYIGLFDSQENYRYAVSNGDGKFRFRVIGGKQHLWVHKNAISPPKGYSMPIKSTFDFVVKNGQTHLVSIQLSAFSHRK